MWMNPAYENNKKETIIPSKCCTSTEHTYRPSQVNWCQTALNVYVFCKIIKKAMSHHIYIIAMCWHGVYLPCNTG